MSTNQNRPSISSHETGRRLAPEVQEEISVDLLLSRAGSEESAKDSEKGKSNTEAQLLTGKHTDSKKTAPIRMHCSRQQQTGVRGRLGFGRDGVSPLLRHSPVRAPSPEDGCADLGSPLPIPTHGPHEVYVGQWPSGLHELQIAALFHKYNIYPTHIHMHRRPLLDSYAFVELSCHEDVVRAVDQLHGGKVLGHQIVVCRSRRQRGERCPPAVEEINLDCGDLDYGDLEEGEEEDPSPPVRRCSPSMPPLVLPTAMRPAIRRRLGDRDQGMCSPLMRAKRFCVQRVGSVGVGMGSPLVDLTEDSSGSAQHDLTQDSGSGHQSGHSSATHVSASVATEVIRQRLRQPVDVLVANFPANTAELDLMDLFSRFKPIRVRIMVSDPVLQHEDFTYAYVTVWNTMMADSAVLGLDGQRFRGRDLVVEVRRSS